MSVKPDKPLTIGRWCVIEVEDEFFLGTVIDEVAGEHTPKRIRIQSKGRRQGEVVQPHEYKFTNWL